MRSTQRKGAAFAVLVIALGAGWLLNVCDVLPGVNWLWTAGLGVTGVIVLAIGGWNQLTVIVGPFLIIGAILSILRQTGRLSLELEAPLLVICFGVLLLLSYVLRLPLPGYLQRAPAETDQPPR